jgi:uncharacterized damage-inducible protein DinB
MELRMDEPLSGAGRVSSFVQTRDALADVLEQIGGLLDGLDSEQYVRAPAGPVRSSVAQHVRHCLDHVRAVVSMGRAGTIDYDCRVRGTDVETSLDAARAELSGLLERLRGLEEPEADGALTLTAQVRPDGASLAFTTSAAREMAFVLSHTIHHNALLSVMARALGRPVPADFGYAPATISHEQSRCAR